MEDKRNTTEVDVETETNRPKRKRKKVYTARRESSLRTEHCSRLSRILADLINQRNWKEASGVLSVLLQGTAREKFPNENRTKYLAAMELLKKAENDHIKLTSVKRVYETWIRKNGPMKKCPVKDKLSLRLEYILFCLTHGSIEDAHQVMIGLMEETIYESDPMLNMMAGLIYYELWYSCIPEDMKLKSSDIPEVSVLQDLSGSHNPVESTCCVSVNDQDVKSPSQGDSASSIGDDKKHAKSVNDAPREPSGRVFQPQGFYSGESAEMSENEEDNDINLTGTSIFKFRGLDVNLLPLWLPELNENFGNSICKYLGTLNDYYAKAVKHLRAALYSDPPVLASLLPLIQLLLLGDQVEEALKELHGICQTSNAALPLRITAVLLECFDSQNSTLLAACYENILNKDPTCSQSLARLVTMHKNGDYGLVSVLEIVALHLDATYAACSVWRELASCFLKVSHCGEDQLSVCGSGDEDIGKRGLSSLDAYPIGFIHGIVRKSWELRCRWWPKRHFSRNAHTLEMEAGDWELLASKAACASHLFGPEFWYVAAVHNSLEKEEKRELFLFLQLHMASSVKVSDQLNSEEIVPDDHSCCSN